MLHTAVRTFLSSGYGRLWAVLSVLSAIGVGVYVILAAPGPREASLELSAPVDYLLERALARREEIKSNCRTENPTDNDRYELCLQATGYYRSFSEEESFKKMRIDAIDRGFDQKVLEYRIKAVGLFVGLSVLISLTLLIFGVTVNWVRKGFKNAA